MPLMGPLVLTGFVAGILDVGAALLAAVRG